MPVAPTTPPTITPFAGPAPNRVTGIPTFSADMDLRLSEWQPNVDQTNAAIAWENTTAQEVYDNAVESNASAGASSSSAGDSENSAIASQSSADNSAASAIQSANSAATASADFTATSSTSLLIEVASKTFAIETGKGFVIGQIVKAASSANPANEMSGEITAASSGSITVLVTQIGGAGTFNDWSISINNPTINDLSINTSEVWSGSKINTELNLKANLASPVFTGVPETTTPTVGDDSEKIASTAFVKTAIDGSPSGISVVSSVDVPSPVAFVDFSLATDGLYKLNLNDIILSGSDQVVFRALVAGVPISSGYNFQRLRANSTTVNAGASAGGGEFSLLGFSSTSFTGDLSIKLSSTGIEMTGVVGVSASVLSTSVSNVVNGSIDGFRVFTNGSQTIDSGNITLRKYA